MLIRFSLRGFGMLVARFFYFDCQEPFAILLSHALLRCEEAFLNFVMDIFILQFIFFEDFFSLPPFL